MSKTETDNLYIAALNIVTDIEYTNDKEICIAKFLKWIVVNNNSNEYITEFLDIKTNTKYYASAIGKGDLFIDLNSLLSMNNLTNKNKLSVEDCNFILEQFKKDYEIDKIDKRKAILETIENYSEIFDEDGKIIIETLAKYGEEITTKEEAFDIFTDVLDITKKAKIRKR